MKAAQTLALINQKLEEDQGESFRTLLGKYMSVATDVYRNDPGPRTHLGASILGNDCARAVWYSFRWTGKEKLQGRIIRLFNRGHMEEPRCLALLEMIGCKIWAVGKDGKQHVVAGSDGHSGGALDCVLKGIPECPDTPLLGEFKTHGDKSFNNLMADGLLKSKWAHYVQMQFYMGFMNLVGGLYFAVNKNTDEIYPELVAFNPVQFKIITDRAKYISHATVPPPKISNDPTWFKCKMCNHRGVCHAGKEPARNCRTCRHVQIDDSGWECGNYTFTGIEHLDKERQEIGCEHYSLNRTFNGG